MKKLACAILFLTILSSFVGLACADTGETIMFHNIPWNISIDELVKALEERGISVSSKDIYNDANMAIWTYDFRDGYIHDIISAGHKISLYDYWNDKNINIAGYPVQEMHFYAHYDISDKVLKLGTNDSRYYMTNIWFDFSDEMSVSVYEDLARKLTNLYGSGTEAITDIFGTTYTYTVWNGASNTAVCLYRSVSNDSDYQFVHLIYGNTAIEETLKNVRQFVIDNKVQSVAEDVTGL